MVWTSIEDANQHIAEANKLKNLNHKNIIQYKDIFLNRYSAETQFVCISLEYCSGGDLQHFIERHWFKYGTMDTRVCRWQSKHY